MAGDAGDLKCVGYVVRPWAQDSQSGRPAFVLTARPLGLRAGIDPTSFNKLTDELDADAFREPRTRVFEQPMTPGEAAGHVRAWLAQPVVQLLEPRADHLERVLSLLESLGTAGHLVTDAQMAALALESDAVLHTTDADFLTETRMASHPCSG